MGTVRQDKWEVLVWARSPSPPPLVARALLALERSPEHRLREEGNQMTELTSLVSVGNENTANTGTGFCVRSTWRACCWQHRSLGPTPECLTRGFWAGPENLWI